MNHVMQLADQEKENLNLVEQNRALADSLADELKKLLSHSSSSSSKKPTPTATLDLDETCAQEELHRQLMEETGAQEELRRQLTKERAEHREDVEALQQVTLLITPLHLRVLLEKARQKILNHIKCDTWEDLRQDKSIYNLTDHVYTHLADTEHPLSRGAVQFLCSYNNRGAQS
ncbi:hypothetical protein PILCRDRAFT_9756 [Piloderma croceum F 1598]|uniref:Uncharacterized protein n=1 Tax=Piloderma croceum (strain F 1598) TaxID=765440 RepID=A0A0C3F6F1_PILCF|nr:hypothetical protein PILCRDRAFT_9756 [Piloderma croceum F 1598]